MGKPPCEGDSDGDGAEDLGAVGLASPQPPGVTISCSPDVCVPFLLFLIMSKVWLVLFSRW